MVFSSVPVYLDPPNWHQQSNHHQQGIGSCTEIPHQFPPLPPNPHVATGGGGLPAAGSIRPGSMSDRARLTKIQQPEAALKCPRCESTNTKFCYFNNYSFSQPRHFCKTCRRYWTRGGALRNVPVGGGCRRNKKSKSRSNSSKSRVNNNSTERSSQSTNNNSNSIINVVVPSEIIGHPQLPFMASLQNLTNQFGLNLSGFPAADIGGSNSLTDHMGFQVGTNSGLSINTHLDMLSAGAGGGGGGVQQFPFFEPLTGLYPFQSNEGIDHHQGQASSSMVGERSTRVSQMAPPARKMEDSSQLLNNLLRPQFSAVSSSENNDNQYWGGNTWTELSGLNSSSANHLL